MQKNNLKLYFTYFILSSKLIKYFQAERVALELLQFVNDFKT